MVLQFNPGPAERVFPTLNPPLTVPGHASIDHPELLPGLVPAGPADTEPGCEHPGCVLDHPHPGPAILDREAAAPAGQKPRRRPSTSGE